MSATAPTAVSALPAAPDPDSAEDTFDVAAFNWAGALATWTAGMNSLAGNAYGNALEAKAQADRAASMADSAAGSATLAQTAASVALGASNFKGQWVNLAGALNKPACVKHNGRFWLLVNNLANVAASTPSDANADWVSMDAGAAPSAVITTDTLAVVGVRYRIAGACKLTLPTSGLLRGDFIGFALMDGVTGASVDFGATKFQGLDVGLVSLNVPRDARSIYYEDATRGFCQ